MLLLFIVLVVAALVYYMYFSKADAAGENNLYLGADEDAELGDDMSLDAEDEE
jgi:hypothetical protein